MPSHAPYAVPNHILTTPVGAGTAGVVYAARHATSTTSTPALAIKLIPRAKLSPATLRQISLHKSLVHPNITSLLSVHAATASTHPSRPTALALVMPLAPRGDLFTRVSRAHVLPSHVLRTYLRDIISALSYLHSRNIAHLDLKLENVVLTSANVAQLIDFDSARNLSDPTFDLVPAGTLQYLAPELVADPAAVSPAADAWALGVLAYVALAGCYPFNAETASATPAENEAATRQRILSKPPHRLSAAVQLPADLEAIVYGLLEKDPNKRITVAEAGKLLQPSSHTLFMFPRPVPTLPGKIVPEACMCRPRSPASTTDVCFDECGCEHAQPVEEALRAAEEVLRAAARAKAEVRRFVTGIASSRPCAAEEAGGKGGEVECGPQRGRVA